MADTKISLLTDGVTADSTDRIPVARAGANRYVTTAYIQTFVQSGWGTGVATAMGVNVGSAGAFVANGGALGTPSSGTLTNATGLPEGGLSLTDILTANVSATAHGFAPKFPNNTTTFLRGDGTYAAPTASATLDGITAAVASQAGIANANWNIRWNWAKTSDAQAAFEFGESAAATGGTSTLGVPNQVLGKFSTLAASTMSPLSVYSRAAHVFSVSPSTRQIFGTNGTQAAPIYSFAGDTDTGFWHDGTLLNISVNNVIVSSIHNTYWQYFKSVYFDLGTAAAPAIYGSAGNQGFFFPSATIGVSISGAESLRFTAGVCQASKGTTDAVSYTINALKARGTVASPTVITTGDDLLTIDAFGYVGATNGYQSAARIVFDSDGVIADTATGIGGIIRFLVAKVGVEPVEVFQARAGGLSFPSTGAAPTVGNAVLVGGTVTVATTAIQTADIVLLTRKTSGGTLGTAVTYTILNDTSFTITSDSGLDTSTFSWVIIKAH